MRTVLLLIIFYFILEFTEDTAQVSNRCFPEELSCLVRKFLTASQQNSLPSKYQDAYDFVFLMCIFPYGTGFIIEDKIFWVLSSVCVWAFLFACCFSLCIHSWTMCTDTTLCGRGMTQPCTFVFAQRQFVIDFALSCLFLELKSWAEPQRSTGLWW